MEYFGASYGSTPIVYVVQQRPVGLCDAVFSADPVIDGDAPVAIGLPDTVWFPEDGLAALPNDVLSFLLFPVQRPEFFDAVVLDGDRVREIQVKQPKPSSNWIWGAFKMPGSVFRELRQLWLARQGTDEYFGTLVNAYLAQGGQAVAVKAGQAYVDVGTLHGYRAAMSLLEEIRDRSTPRDGGTPLPAHNGDRASELIQHAVRT
jgi:glucose-1-phosphate thymidylyltransferase